MDITHPTIHHQIPEPLDVQQHHCETLYLTWIFSWPDIYHFISCSTGLDKSWMLDSHSTWYFWNAFFFFAQQDHLSLAMKNLMPISFEISGSLWQKFSDISGTPNASVFKRRVSKEYSALLLQQINSMKHSTLWEAISLSAGQELRGENTDTVRERIQFCKEGNKDSDTKMGHNHTAC